MSSKLTKRQIDHYLYEVAKEYKKRNRNDSNAEIILVGGASIIINYNLRDTTTDIDALIKASSDIKDSIRQVGDENSLNIDWLNEDFKKTISFSTKLVEHSKYYRQFYGITIRTVADEYLLAMKVQSGRLYKNDLSDLVGIIYESNENGNPITYDKLDKAMHELYGGWQNVKEEIKDLLKYVYQTNDLQELYHQMIEKEEKNKQIILQTSNGRLTDDDIHELLL